jgi:hypothetical protein
MRLFTAGFFRRSLAQPPLVGRSGLLASAASLEQCAGHDADWLQISRVAAGDDAYGGFQQMVPVSSFTASIPGAPLTKRRTRFLATPVSFLICASAQSWPGLACT